MHFNKSLRFYILLGLLAISLHFVKLFCLKQTDGFTILGISSHRPFNPAWEIGPLSQEEKQELENALNQQYTYFGCGGQSFIFFSQDQKYALKLFKQCKFDPPTYLNYVPIPWALDRYKAKKTWKREDKLERDFGSYQVAFTELKNETGLLYVHLNKTSYLKKQLRIVDRLGIEHKLDLDTFDFVLQHKAELVHDTIGHLMQTGQMQEARKKIASLLHLIVSRAQKGFHDRDPNIRTNCGFLKDTAIKIDVGRFVRNEKMKEPKVYIKQVQIITYPFREWIKTTYPSLLPVFDEEFKKIHSDE